MVKVIHEKHNTASNVGRKKISATKKKINPFEIHINKDKHKVLGRKSKDDRGFPGVTRSKAINKRKRTLLREFTSKDKDNVFIDKRIGEGNTTMSQEEKTIARYAAEKMKIQKKRNIFNLNDEEVLTHRGQTLEQIEQFEDLRSDDESSDEENPNRGKLGQKFVNNAHFGSGLLSKSSEQSSGKQLIADLIAESKKRKAEIQNTREQTIQLTEKLDSEWRDLAPFVKSAKELDSTVPKPSVDDYDKALRSLQFERRGQPSDRLKSEEELLKKEKEKLEALEENRLARMKGFSDDSVSRLKHKSADDLDDEFIVEQIEDEPLTYDKNGIVKSNHFESKADEVYENSNNDSSDDTDNVENQENYGSQESIEHDDDNLDDLRNSESSSDEEDMTEIKNRCISIVSPSIVEQNKKSEEIHINKQSESEPCRNDNNVISAIRKDLVERKEMMEKARKELPYTYKAPTSLEELTTLLENQSPEHQSIIMERIIKCNHWSAGEDNHEKMCRVFEFLLEYIINIFIPVNKQNNILECFSIIDRLCPHLFNLAQVNSKNTATCVQKLLKDKHEDFRKSRKKYPGLDTLILFKIISLLFPTSDFRHPIVTPSLVLMSQILLSCHVKTKTDISKGIFIVTLILEYTVFSKRFLPAAINFLRGIIYLGMMKPLLRLPKIIPPFKSIGEFSNLLELEKNYESLDINIDSAHMKASDLMPGAIDDDFKLRVLLTAMNLINEFKVQLEKLEIVYSIFEPIHNLLKINSWEKYPKNCKQHVEKICSDLENLAKIKLEPLFLEEKKPKALKLYEPRIEKIYDGKKFKPMSKTRREREKLIAKVKKETKGVMREIRRDTVFLAKVQIEQKLASDAERKRKVKEIYGNAATQQGELNKLKRKKN